MAGRRRYFDDGPSRHSGANTVEGGFPVNDVDLKFLQSVASANGIYGPAHPVTKVETRKLSAPCKRGAHSKCTSVHCECECRHY